MSEWQHGQQLGPAPVSYSCTHDDMAVKIYVRRLLAVVVVYRYTDIQIYCRVSLLISTGLCINHPQKVICPPVKLSEVMLTVDLGGRAK